MLLGLPVASQPATRQISIFILFFFFFTVRWCKKAELFCNSAAPLRLLCCAAGKQRNVNFGRFSSQSPAQQPEKQQQFYNSVDGSLLRLGAPAPGHKGSNCPTQHILCHVRLLYPCDENSFADRIYFYGWQNCAMSGGPSATENWETTSLLLQFFPWVLGWQQCQFSLFEFTFKARYLVDPASSHMLVSKIKPCMSKYKPH